MKPENVFGYRGEFFKIVGKTSRSQVGVMTVPAGGDSGPEETHDADQIVYIIEGNATIEIGPESYEAQTGYVVIIPAHTRHHIYNTGAEELFFLTLYAPPAY